MPRVTVILPTYKRPDYLKKAITSVTNQNYKDWEIIVIGRKSGVADQNAAIVESFRQQGLPIVYIEHEEPGVSAARNIGIAKAGGEFVAFLDDDDQWLPLKLESQAAFLDANPDAGLVYGTMEIHREIDGCLKVTSVLPRKLITDFSEMFDDDFWISPTMAMVRTSCLKAMDKWFDPQYLIGEDWEFWMRFARRWKMGVENRPVAMTVKDGHESLSQNQAKSAEQGILILQNLRLEKEYERFAGVVQRHTAKLHYRLGQRLMAAKDYRAAAGCFVKALLMNPMVGLTIPRKSDGLALKIWQFLKSLLAAPGCFLLGIFYPSKKFIEEPRA